MTKSTTKTQSILKLCQIQNKMTSTPTETNIASTEPPAKKQKCLGFKGIENVQRILECPVCYNTPGNPDEAHFCSNGHLLCDTCHKKIVDKKCPTCRSEDWNGHHALMPLMKQILSVLPKICPFGKCKTQFESVDREIHLKNCQYRLVDCIGCSSKVPFKTLLKHLDVHDTNTKENIEGRFTKYIVVTENDITDRTCESWLCNKTEFDGQTFIAVFKKEMNNFCAQIFLHGNLTDAEKYLCQIKVTNGEDPRYNISFSGDIISVDVPIVDETREKHSGTFSFGKTMARRLLNKLANGDGLCIDITIFKKE